MSRVPKWNVDKFCTHTSSVLLQMSENRGNDGQAFDKIYEVLTYTPYPSFNFEIFVFKQVNISNLDIGLLLIKAREEYRALVAKGTWRKTTEINEEQ